MKKRTLQLKDDTSLSAKEYDTQNLGYTGAVTFGGSS